MTQVRAGQDNWDYRRARIVRQLEQDGEQHLIVVRYQERDSWHVEWVYNEADIDRAKVVWAREMDAARNLELLRYFNGRRVWLLSSETGEWKLTAYDVP